MKNYLFKQAKKSVSLLMAVLMLMTCWVWVAPEKAEAGAPTNYDVTISYYVGNAANRFNVNITHAANNGTGSTTSTGEMSMGPGTNSGNNGKTMSSTFSVSGFPTQIYVEAETDWFNDTEVQVKSISINGKTVLEGTWTLNPGWGGNHNRTFVPSSDGLSGTASGKAEGKWEWTKPKLNAATATLSPASHTLAKINSGINSTSTISLSGFVDDYGVNWTGAVTSTFTLRVDDGVTPGQNATITGSGNSRTITIKPWFQTLYPGKQNAKLYVDWNINNNTKSGTETIDITFPTYKATFDANGGKIGNDDTEAKDKIVLEGEKMNIGSIIGKAPAYATKDGFTFKGFYSTKNADATGLTASFSGTEFEDGVTKVDANGDKTWYAAWQALPITATFVTADNQLIGTVEGRYNNYLTASNMYNGDTGLNAAVEAAYTGSTVNFNSDHEPVYTDGSITYTFAGWKIIEAYDESVVDGNEDTVLKGDVTFQAVYTKADAAKYSVKFYDGNGNVINDASNKSDYNYRDDVILPSTEPSKAQDDKYRYEFIGWAKNIGKNFYAVDEYDCDENGAKIVYTHKDGAEFIVKGDASYVPVFRMIPREYSVTFNYTVDGGATESMTVDGYHWLDGVTMPEEIKNNYTKDGFRYYIDGWNVGSDATKKQLDEISVNGNLTLTATYGAGEPAEYTINFFDKDGNLLNADSNIFTHNSAVTAPEVDQTIDTEDSLYTFVAFKDKNGNLYSQTATGDADYYAEYTKKDYADIHYYNYDGTLLYELDGKENAKFVGDIIPEYSNMVGGENVLPSKAEDNVGTYNFTGWKDGNGNVVVPGTDEFTGDTYLYAQFETVYKEYTVKFINEGEIVSEETYHYGEPIVIPEEEPTKDADETYSYDFKAWDPDVSEVCYGDAEYTATYRSYYNYYKVTWLTNDKTVSTAVNYTYNKKINKPGHINPIGLGEAGDGYEWVIKDWIQCDANGNPVDANGVIVEEATAATFVNGQRMPAKDIYFYPTYEKKASVYEVYFYDSNEEDTKKLLGMELIPYGEAIAPYGENYKSGAAKAADDTHHYEFNKWIAAVNGSDAIIVDESIAEPKGDNNENVIIVYADHIKEEHNKVLYEVVKAPTCTETGIGNYKCDTDACNMIDYNVILDVIPDEGKPTGQVYIGTSKWTEQEYADKTINYDDEIYAGPSTNIIVNAKDTGTRSKPWNLEAAINRGVGRIDYYVSEEAVADPSGIQTWTNAYSYDTVKAEVLKEVLLSKGMDDDDYFDLTFTDNTKKLAIDAEVDAILATYNANATGVLENLNLINGKEYIIYLRVSDREVNGQSNVIYFSTGKFHYGTTAATVDVAGEGFGTKFCAKATITVTDDTADFTVTIDGEEVELTGGKYTTDKAGVHIVEVIDKNGNKTVKTFEIKGSHTFRNYTIAPTCDKAGSRYDLCTLCGVKARKVPLPATGHNFTTFTEKAPNCVDDGSRTYTCANGCGETLVIKWNSSADDLAKAKKLKEGTEGEWISITAEDVKHLKATGSHTYAKVPNEDGSDSTEDAWVIDKAATCVADGSKHKDCTICGDRTTEAIPKDEVNGHKYYRAKTAQEPTCTEQGWKNATCKYCAYVKEQVEMIPALGHTEGEYKVIKEADCTNAGEKVLTCAVCDIDIGEADDDGNYNLDNPVTVEIAALGHKLVFSHVVEPTTDENGNPVQGYSLYVCARNCGHTEKKDYFDKIEEYTLTFMNGDEPVKTMVVQQGNTVTADMFDAVPEKAADATYKYSFRAWATKNADGTFTDVAYPIEAKADATYYAQFDSKYINYTITYMKEDGVTQYKKVGYLHNGEAVELADGPAKSADVMNSYKFAGWVLGDKTYTDTYTIEGKDVTFVASYTEVKKQYAVTYAYTKSDILETFLVDAGTPARDCYKIPVKAVDSKYHYEFAGWNKAAQLLNVESNIYTTPNFKGIEHDFETIVKTDATCTTDRVETKKCKDCAYSYDVTVPNTAHGHNFSDPVYNEETGKSTVTCQICGHSEEDASKYTVNFYADINKDPIKTISYISWGTKIDAIRLPADPVKDATTETEYTFKGWALKSAPATVVEVTEVEIKKDTDFVAVFEAKTRTYTVIFAYDAYNIIETHKYVPAGSDVTYAGNTPVKAYDEVAHYAFSNWSGLEKGDNTIENVQGDVYVTAKFDKIGHTYTPEKIDEATCQHGEGTKYTCECGHFYTVSGKPLPHNYEKTENFRAPTATQDGFQEYKCTACGDTYEETLKFIDNTITITVTVKHNGTPESGIRVEIQPKGGNTPVVATTNANGVAVFKVDKDSAYSCWVTVNGQKKEITLENAGNGDLQGNYNYTDRADCTCACHRDNVWGAIFRFFHKIIKLFTGEFKCCGNPDPMYG